MVQEICNVVLKIPGLQPEFLGELGKTEDEWIGPIKSAPNAPKHIQKKHETYKT